MSIYSSDNLNVPVQLKKQGSLSDQQVLQLTNALGPLAGGMGGGILADDRHVSTGLATGAGNLGGSLLGSTGGALAGGALGTGAGAGIGALTGLDQQKLINLLGGLGAVTGGIGGSVYGGIRGGETGYKAVQGGFDEQGETQSKSTNEDAESSDDADDADGDTEKNSHYIRTKHAYALGSIDRLEEQGLSAGKFVKIAGESNDPELLKIANKIVRLYEDINSL